MVVGVHWTPGQLLLRLFSRGLVAAFSAYRDDVTSGRFPAEEHTYPMKDDQLAAFREGLEQPPF